MPTLNPFVWLNKNRIVKNKPQEHIVIYPDKGQFINSFNDAYPNPEANCPFFGKTAFSVDPHLLDEARAIRCVRGNFCKVKITLPFLSNKLKFPLTDQAHYVFTKLEKDSFPLPEGVEQKIIIDVDTKNEPKIKIRYGNELDTFVVYKFEQGICNQIEIRIQKKGSKVANSLISFSFFNRTSRFLPEKKDLSPKKGFLCKEWRLTTDSGSYDGAIALDNTLLQQPVVLKKSVLERESTNHLNCLPGYYNESYRIEGKLLVESLGKIQNSTYTNLANLLGITSDEHFILGDRMLFSNGTLMKKVQGMALGITVEEGDMKMKRLSSEFVYTDGPCTLLWGNIIIQPIAS